MAGTTFSTANWTGYATHTADITEGSSALTAFSLLIDIAELGADSADWESNVQSDGADIRCTDEDDNELPFDLIDWSYNSGAPTGLIRVKRSLSASDSTEKVRVWCGYTGGEAVAYSATETYGSDNAYDSSWEGYWPLHDLNDRTSNGNDMTAYGSPTSGAAGKLGQCYQFDSASSQYLERVGAVVTDTPITMMGWFYLDSFTTSLSVIAGVGSDETGVPATMIFHRDTSPDYVAAQTQNTTFARDEKTLTTSLSTWYHCCGRWESDASREVALDSIFTGSPETTSITVGSVDTTAIGRLPSRTFYYMDGRIDDVQIHSTARSSAWISHEYDQTNDNATFWGTWSWTAASGDGTATAAATTGGFTCSASAAVTNPTYDADAAATIGGVEVSASATFTGNTYTATAAATAGAVTAAVTATHTAPTYDASAAATIGGVESSSTAAFAAAISQATVSATIGGSTAAASATFAAESTADVAVTVGGTEVSVSATHTAPTYTGAGAVTVGGVSAAVIAVYAIAVYQADCAVASGAVTASAAGTFTASTATVPDGVDYRVTDGRPHYRVTDGRPHYRVTV